MPDDPNLVYTYCCTACHAGWQTEDKYANVCRWCGSRFDVVLRGVYGSIDLKQTD